MMLAAPATLGAARTPWLLPAVGRESGLYEALLGPRAQNEPKEAEGSERR